MILPNQVYTRGGMVNNVEELFKKTGPGRKSLTL